MKRHKYTRQARYQNAGIWIKTQYTVMCGDKPLKPCGKRSAAIAAADKLTGRKGENSNG